MSKGRNRELLPMVMTAVTLLVVFGMAANASIDWVTTTNVRTYGYLYPNAIVTVNPERGPAGSWVYINGTGFTSNAVVLISFAGEDWTVAGADSNGNFSKSAEIPAKDPGTYEVRATWAGDGECYNTTNFTVTLPNMTLIPSRGPKGANITVNATGFVVNSTMTVQYWNGTSWSNLASMTGPDNETTVTIPEDITTTTVNNETVNIRVKGEGGGILPTKQPTYYAYALYSIVSPGISLDPSRGLVNYSVNVSGESFTPNDYAVIRLSNDTINRVVGGTSISSDGTFTTNITIPSDLWPGPYNIIAIDGKLLKATAVFEVLSEPEPEINVTPNKGPVNIAVELKVSGFSANEPINISYYNETGAWNLTISDTTGPGGQYTTSWVVPEDINTTVKPNIRAEQNSTTYGILMANTTYEVTPTIGISPAEGIVGTSVTVSGKAFGNVTAYFDGKEVEKNTTAPAGNVWRDYSISFNVPEKPSGTYSVNITDEKGLSNSTNFTVLTNITLNASEGYVGDMLLVNGTGFGAGVTASIYFNDTLVKNVTTDENGTFKNAVFAVPSISAGTYKVLVKDTTGRNESMNFTVKPKLEVSPKEGKVGENITLTGTAFGSNENVTIKWNNTDVGIYPKTDEKGTFSVNMTVPPSSAGTYNITAIGNVSGIKANTTFNVSMTLFLSALRNGTEVNGTWPNTEIVFKVVQGDKTTPAIAKIYINGVGLPEPTNASGMLSYTFEDKGIYNVHAENASVSSNTIEFKVDDPSLVLEANRTKVNPGQSVMFNTTDQFGYSIGGADVRINGIKVGNTSDNGSFAYIFTKTGAYEVQAEWTYKGDVLRSNIVNVTVKQASLRLEPKVANITINESVQFKAYNEWNESVKITNITVSPGTEGVNWTIDVPNATVTFFKAGEYIVNATDGRVSATAVVYVTAVLRNFSVSITPSAITVNKSTTVLVNVTDADTGEPVEGANVSLSGCNVTLSDTTNASGIATFEVNATSTGNITVTVSKKGYNTWTKEDGIVVRPALMEGDVDMNGCVDISDAMFIAQYTVGLRTLNESQLKCADTTDDDGNVDISDAMHIAQYTVDPDGSLGVLYKPLWESPADDDMMKPVPCA